MKLGHNILIKCPETAANNAQIITLSQGRLANKFKIVADTTTRR